jgi:hypothetical protein
MINPPKLLLAALLCLTLAPSLAAAQDAQPELPVVAEPAPLVEEQPTSAVVDAAPVEDPRAWVLYQAAFDQCAAGERERCKASLRGLIKLYPDHSAARLAEGTLAQLAANPRRAQPPRLTAADPIDPDRQGSNGERYTLLAHAELMAVQTLNGALLGAELCALAGCDDARVEIGVSMAGALGALGITAWLSDGGVTPGHAVAINSGTYWGAVIASLFSFSDMDTPSGTSDAALVAISGRFIGLGLGHLYYKGVAPSAGQVGFTNTVGLWSFVGYGLLHDALDLGLDSGQLSFGGLVALNGGLIAGHVLAQGSPMSRGRALLLDAGGLAGLLTGMGLYFLATDESSGQGFYTSALLGTGLGLGTSAYLTRDWDADDEDVQRRRNLPSVSLVPGDAIAPVAGERQGGFGVSASWAW